MNNSAEKTTSCLAVVEKKTHSHRPGGCVGVFFQLFDWNRRLAKKKLFSKKLLSPGRLKLAASKKFGGDEKQPKLRLIDDENSGGFPTAKKSHFAEEDKLRTPSLVARLMGLESMPAVHRQKSKKVSVSGVDSVRRHFKEDVNVDKGGGVNHEPRPQKLQKTNVSEKRSVSKFGGEALPLKSVLSKSRKHHHHHHHHHRHHHPRLPSPVKSPRNLSRKSLSTLIGAATRILEPGLQSNNMNRALTYSKAFLDQPRSSYMDVGQSSSENHGHFHDHIDSEPKQPLVFPSPFSHSCGVASSQNLDEELQRIAGSAMDDMQSRAKYASDIGKYSRQTQQYSGNEQLNRKSNVPLPLNSIQDAPFQIKKSWAGEEFALRSKPNGMRSRKVPKTSTIVDRKNMPQLVAARTEYGKFELHKRMANEQSSLVPPRERKRTTSISGQAENPSPMNSVRNGQLYHSHDAISGKKFGYHANKMILHSCNSGLTQRQDTPVDNLQVENKDVSFLFKSRGKQTDRAFEPAKRKVRNNIICCEEDSSPKLALRENDPRTKVEKPLHLTGNELSALLEQKLKELNSQEDDLQGKEPKKTTATILQELISALTSETPFHMDKAAALSDERNSLCSKSHLSESTSSTNSQVNAMEVSLPSDLALDAEHLSPGSVLEACFSNDSCPSSSVDYSIGDKTQIESLNFPSYGSQSPHPDTREAIRNVSEILCCIYLANSGLKGSKLSRAKEVLLNAELVSRSSPAIFKGSTINHLLCNELDTLASVLWMNFGSCLGTEDGKDVNQLKGFAFDSVIEYLDIRFGNYDTIVGSKVSIKFPLCMNTKSLMLDVVEEVRRWKNLSEFVLDDLINREMSHSLQEWTLFETECFETGLEISSDLLQVLVDETVTDLWNC